MRPADIGLFDTWAGYPDDNEVNRSRLWEEALTVKVNTMWEIHSHHTRVPCQCGGEYAFDLAAIGEWTAERKTEKFISKCSDCGDRVLTEFDITDRSQEMDDLDRMLMKKWPPASSGPSQSREVDFKRLVWLESLREEILGIEDPRTPFSVPPVALSQR